MVLRTLGGLVLEGTAFRRPRPLLLLAYLALEGPTERRRLAELLWMNAADPRHSLATALTQLRRGAPGAVEGDEVRLWTPLACDAAALRRAAGPEALLAASEEYRGPFLEGAEPADAGVELEEWIWSAREALAARARDALLLQAGRDADAGDFVRAAAWAERALTLAAAPEPEPELLARAHLLLLAGDHPRSREVAAEARALGATVAASVEEARELAVRVAPPGGDAPELPRHGTSFVGRARELAELAVLTARPEVRLVTVLGAGGAGKSRLALQHARAVAEERYARVGFVALDALDTTAAIPGAAVAALGVALAGTDPAEALARAVGAARTLLVFDNFEHLLGGAPLLSGLLARCPNLDLLATSRERLALAEEWLFPLGGLALPDEAEAGGPEENDEGDDRAAGSDALRLFAERAAQAGARPLTPGARRGALRACRLVGGNALAIELAAAWARLLPIERIADELERTLDLLARRDPHGPERQRSVRAAFEHSWALLDDAERGALRRLAVFRGGFAVEAARRVAGADVVALAALQDASLLEARGDGRFDLHPLVAAFAGEELARTPAERAAVEAAHAGHFLELLRTLEDDIDPEADARTLAPDFENVRAALERLPADVPSDLHRRLRRVGEFLDDRGRYGEAQELFAGLVRRLEALPAGAPGRAAALGAARIHEGWACMRQGRYRIARELAERGLERLAFDEAPAAALLGHNLVAVVDAGEGAFAAAKERRDAVASLIDEAEARGLLPARLTRRARAANTANRAEVEVALGDYAAAAGHYREAVEQHERLGLPALMADNLVDLGFALLGLERFDEALAATQRGLELARATGMRAAVAFALRDLAMIERERGRPRRALELAEEALALGQAIAYRVAVIDAGIVLGGALADLGDLAGAERRLLEALALAREAGAVPKVLDALAALGELRATQGRSDEAASLLRLALHHPNAEHLVWTRAERALERLPAVALPAGGVAADLPDLEAVAEALVGPAR